MPFSGLSEPCPSLIEMPLADWLRLGGRLDMGNCLRSLTRADGVNFAQPAATSGHCTRLVACRPALLASVPATATSENWSR
jgi:hypothetical protein